MIFSRLSQKNFFLDLAIQCGGIYIWEFKDEEFFFEYPVGDQSPRIELEEMWRLIHPDDLTAFKLLWQSLWKADKEVFQCRARFAGSDYKWWEFRFSAMPALDNAERGKDVSGILININDMKKREKELILMRGYEQKFLANMSHEIRTPLNAIVGFSDVLSAGDTAIDDQRGYFEIIKANSDLLLRLINDILDVSRLEADRVTLTLEKCDVVQVCTQVTASVTQARRSSNRIVFESAADSLEIRTDIQRLQQVVINLLSNADKFTENGTITLKLEPDMRNRTALFSVSDTGCGIPPEKRKRVFERFEKLNEYAQGTGLGLSICKLIVEKWGGRIWIDSQYTRGARFVFTHPLDL